MGIWVSAWRMQKSLFDLGQGGEGTRSYSSSLQQDKHMRRPYTRQRRVLASVTLACWLFAFVVGVVQACGLHEALSFAPHAPTASVDSQDRHGDDDAHQHCERNGADEMALLAKLQSVQDQPGGQAFILPPGVGDSFLARLSTSPVLLYRPRPPPGIAVYTLFARLAL